MRSASTLLLLVWLAAQAPGAEVRVVRWRTDHASPPAKLDGPGKGIVSLIRSGVAMVPEPMVMQMTFFGGSALGLPREQARKLHDELSERYKLIAADPVFGSAPSALAYCWSERKPERGYATVYGPDKIAKDTPAIVFLHGYGGSMMFYAHYLASEFPDHIIVCPAYGISPSHIPAAYLGECLSAASKELKIEIGRPVLIGLSAGGFGAFRAYARQPGVYAGLICVAAYPPKDVLARSPPSGRIRLVAGGKEGFVLNGELQRSEAVLRKRTPDYSSTLIANEDHLFLLTSEKATKNVLRRWVGELEAGRGAP